MKLVRFILPFLFVRNWYDGAWELSRPRLMLFGTCLFLILIGLVLAWILGGPVVYTKSV